MVSFSRLVFSVAALIGVTFANPIHPREYYEEKFIAWMTEHGKEWESGAEFVRRLDIWAANHDYIEHINAQNHSYKLGHNRFSHMTLDEFHQHFKLGDYAKYKLHQDLRTGEKETNNFRYKVEDEVDWSGKGVVTPVKDQGQCGSCWAFSTTGALEGAYALKNGDLKSFSEQELVDCDSRDAGCNGGLMDNAFSWIKSNGGLCTEDSYTYTAQDGSCQKSGCSTVDGSAVVSYIDIAQNDAALTAAVAKQPVAVAIEADQRAFQLYASGVFTGACGTNLDHGVLVVGYGSQDGYQYYKVKNSWGPAWGDNGYILIEKNKSQRGGQCGILLAASYPTV